MQDAAQNRGLMGKRGENGDQDGSMFVNAPGLKMLGNDK